MKKRPVVGLIILLLAIAAFALVIRSGAPLRWAFTPTGTGLSEGIHYAPTGDAGDGAEDGSSEDGTTQDKPAPAHEPVEIVAEGLRIPWEIAFLPDGDMLVTERPGTLRKVGANGAVIDVPGVVHVGEGGLLGLALHPAFDENRFIYLYLTTRNGGMLVNRIDRYVFDGTALSGRETIFGGIPGAQYHDGGRIAFGPDGKLYATTGDAGDTASAQDRDALSGKILRINDDGSIPSDNPFGTAVWSYGHRNPQGIDWDDRGRMWSSEHGRSGARSGMDEVNLIEAGRNYGWPTLEGDAVRDGMTPPRAHSGASETWAPGDIAWFNGRAFFTGLRGEALYEASVNDGGDISGITAHFRRDFGRLRAAVVGPDGALYLTTSNTDGRGSVRDGDDRIIRVDPSVFE